MESNVHNSFFKGHFTFNELETVFHSMIFQTSLTETSHTRDIRKGESKRKKGKIHFIRSAQVGEQGKKYILKFLPKAS